VESEPALDVLAHALAADHQPLDEPGRANQQIVEEDRGVGQVDPFGG
jgi:hypothetical protein